MGDRVSTYRGCLLGMAVGDAMGYTVDEKTWEEIREDYGPGGLLGYDLVNGTAEVSSYTQTAAFALNGLILALNRGKWDSYPKYIALALREWYKKQVLPRDPERTWCWVAKVPQLRRRHCRDSRMMDALRLDSLGTPESPKNRNDNPGALTVAAMVGLMYDPRRMQQAQIGEVAARAVALTHGSPEAFLSGAVAACAMAGIVQTPEESLKTHFLRAIEATEARFGLQFPQTADLVRSLRKAVAAAELEEDLQAGMEKLSCDSAGQCLAGAMFACLVAGEDFDTAMITAINHSGRSAAVGALAGAFLGAKLRAEALPEFYLESLPVTQVLECLASDAALGSPTTGLFDDDWDLKYTHGTPVGIHIEE